MVEIKKVEAMSAILGIPKSDIEESKIMVKSLVGVVKYNLQQRIF